MKTLYNLSIIAIVIIFASCESKTFLRSKKGLGKDIKGHWLPIKGTSTYGNNVHDKNIQWKFEGGEFTLVQVVVANGVDSEVVIDKGTYSIDTKIDNAYVSISDVKAFDTDPSFKFNIKWTIIQLNGGILDLAGRPANGGLVEVEFEKKD